MWIRSDLRRHHIVAFPRLSDHIQRMVQRNRPFDKAAAVIRIRDGGQRAFAVVQRIAATTGLFEHRRRFDRRPVWPDQKHTAVVLQVERNRSAAGGNGGPAAFAPSACLRSSVAIGVRLGHRPRPELLHIPLVLDAGDSGEVTGQRRLRLCGPLQFDKPDKHPAGFRRRHILDQPLAPRSTKGSP